MPITASDIIRRTMRLLGVVDATTALESVDAQDALDTLNAMLAEWHAAGVGLPVFSFASLTDQLPTDAGDRDAIAYQLGGRLAPEYGIPLSAEFGVAAEAAMNRLRLRYFQPGTVTYDVPMYANCFNIVTGE